MSNGDSIPRWMESKREPGRADRTGSAYDPATGPVQSRVALAATNGIVAAVASEQTPTKPLKSDHLSAADLWGVFPRALLHVYEAVARRFKRSK